MDTPPGFTPDANRDRSDLEEAGCASLGTISRGPYWGLSPSWHIPVTRGSVSPQASPQTVTLTQATAAGPQVQMIPAVTATAQVVQQKLIQQQVVTSASAPLQAPGGPSPAQVPTGADSPSQQPKLHMRVPAVRLKTPTKPPCQ